MHRKTITVTKEMEAYIQSRVKSGDYGNDSEYMRDLIRHDQEYQEAIETLRKMIDEAEASGISDRTPEEIMADFLKSVPEDAA